MNDPAAPVRVATPGDAPELARLVNMAGGGLPLYLWGQLAEPGQSPWQVGEQRAQRESGSFSYRNAWVLEQDGEIAAFLAGYPLEDRPTPAGAGDMPATLVPLQELENLARGTWYLNGIAVFPRHRGKGFGAKLLQLAESLARRAHSRGVSLIVSSTNTGARRLYERTGYREVARRPLVTEDWDHPAADWLLMIKEFKP